MHISPQYSPSRILNILSKELPENLKKRVLVCTDDAFGNGKPVSLVSYHPQPNAAASSTDGGDNQHTVLSCANLV